MTKNITLLTIIGVILIIVYNTLYYIKFIEKLRIKPIMLIRHRILVWKYFTITLLCLSFLQVQ